MGLILHANDQARQIFGIEEDLRNKEHYLDGFVSLTSTPILVDEVVFTKWQDLLAINSNACILEEPSKTIEFLAACNDSAMLTEFLGHIRLTFLSKRIFMAYIRMTDDCENLPNLMDIKIHETEEDDVYYEDDEFQKNNVETMSGSEDPNQIDYTMNSVMNVSPDPIFYIQSAGIIIQANDSASKLFGFSTNEFIGNNINLFFGDELNNNTTHDNFHIQNYIHTENTENVIRKIALTAQRKDGTEFPIELVMAEIDSMDANHKVFCVFVRDLTECKVRESELIHQQQILHGIIDCSLDPVFQMNSSGIIELVNQAAVTLFGYENKDDMIGKKLSMLLNKEQADIHNLKFCQYLETEERKNGIVEKRRELLARRKDDSEFLVQFTVVEIPTIIGNERLFAGFFYDLTETKKYLAHEVENVVMEALAIISPLTMLVEI
jgi:PAS domain S-box-containing protein